MGAVSVRGEAAGEDAMTLLWAFVWELIFRVVGWLLFG